MLHGLMQDQPLLISQILRHAARWHGEREIVSIPVEGGEHRYTYADAELRCRKLAQALTRLGIGQGDRVGTLAWNTWRHFELFFGVPSMGAVCHTINPRLFPDQIRYIVNHAEDQVLCFDTSFLSLVEQLAPTFEHVRHYIIMTDQTNMPDTSLPNALCYEDIVAAEDGDFDFPLLDEMSASSLCYTSGTTGDPKGVLYAHRSTVLHSYAACMPDTHALSAMDVSLPVAPMFHANAWGIPYAAALVGAKLVLPGRDVSGAALYDLINREKVSHAVAVPTVWLDFLSHVERNKLDISSLGRTVIGGTAVPRSMYERFNALGVNVFQGWGMTELSPLGTAGQLKPGMEDLPRGAQLDILVKQGRPPFGIDLRIVDDSGDELPWDGKAFGLLQVRGPWVTSGYLKRDEPVLDNDGWFDTGDVATIDPKGYMQITDRAKDVIKSGGEWISSIDLENAAMGHPDVAEAAVIGIPHPKWDERPLLVVVPKSDPPPGKQDILDFLASKVAKWWLPDDVVFIAELPHTATGKVQKMALRKQFKGHQVSAAGKSG